MSPTENLLHLLSTLKAGETPILLFEHLLFLIALKLRRSHRLLGFQEQRSLKKNDSASDSEQFPKIVLAYVVRSFLTLLLGCFSISVSSNRVVAQPFPYEIQKT